MSNGDVQCLDNTLYDKRFRRPAVTQFFFEQCSGARRQPFFQRCFALARRVLVAEHSPISSTPLPAPWRKKKTKILRQWTSCSALSVRLEKVFALHWPTFGDDIALGDHSDPRYHT